MDVYEALKVRRVRAPRPTEKKAAPGTLARRDDPEKWEEAANKIYEVLHELGLRATSALGCGSFGCVYEGAPYVVKITGDPTEVANAKRVVEHGGCPGVVSIYSVYGFKGVPSMYAILREPLEPTGPKVVEWIDKHRLDFQRYLLHTGDSTEVEYQKKVSEARRHARQLRIKESIEELIEGLDCLYDLGVLYEDGHGGNVMVRAVDERRVLVYSDLGYSAGPTVRIPLLETR